MHLFNTAGYYYFFQVFIGKAEERLVQSLDNNQYSHQELIELKVALHLPYMNNSEYTRVDGEIEIEGVHYNYVKRKISNDTLYLLCLPNTEKTKLLESRAEYTQQAADLPANGKHNSGAAKKMQPLAEYNSPLLSYSFYNPVQPEPPACGLCIPQLACPHTDDSFRPPESFFA